MQSLRTRAFRGAAIWAVMIVVSSFLALNTTFNKYSNQRFDEHLASHHRQLIIALGNSGGNIQMFTEYVFSPETENAFSGHYWQLVAPNGEIFTSGSMVDSVIEVPDAMDAGQIFWDGSGPTEKIRGIHQNVILENGDRWVVTAAVSLGDLDREQLTTRRWLLIGLVIVGAIGTIGVIIQLSVILAPLYQLQKDVAQRWTAGKPLNEQNYPEEVAPLVNDINNLLKRNRSVIESARRQAADLAHALKTPTAVLQNCLEKEQHTQQDFEAAQVALDKIHAQINRSLARIRAGNASATAYSTDLKTSAERLARLFRATSNDDKLNLELDIEDGTIVAMDQQDIEEVLGNLIENAVKWHRRTIRLSSRMKEDRIHIRIDDDGPGVPEERRKDVLRPGERLDVSAPGTGLGLAIANDLVTAYGGYIELDQAPSLGGLRVTIHLTNDGTSLGSPHATKDRM